MTSRFRLKKETTGLLLVDVQEKVFRLVERPCEVMISIRKIVHGFQIMGLPIVATEQYPKGLGGTVEPLKELLGKDQKFWDKVTFSCMGSADLKKHIQSLPVKQWVVAGIEAHVCVLQTVRDLIEAGKEVVVLNDAITSRSIYDFSTAIAEMRDYGARISSTEIVLFELMENSTVPEFKQISELIKTL